MAQILVMPMMGMAVFSGSAVMAIGSLIGHLVYGAVVGVKYGEIADVLGIPVGTVKSRLFRGRRILQDQLREFAVRNGYVQERSQ